MRKRKGELGNMTGHSGETERMRSQMGGEMKDRLRGKCYKVEWLAGGRLDRRWLTDVQARMRLKQSQEATKDSIYYTSEEVLWGGRRI